MAQNNVLRWQDGRGWLVLSGGAAIEGDIRASVLERATAEGGVAYIAVNAPENSDALNDMDDLGAPPGYIVDVLTEDDETIRARLSEAGIIVIEDTETPEELRSGLMGAAAEGIQEAYERGAIVLAEGHSASLMGEWAILSDERQVAGLGWVAHGVVLPRVTSIAENPSARDILEIQPEAVAIGIALGSALVLGPNGEIETWGNKQVTIALGRAYQQ